MKVDGSLRSLLQGVSQQPARDRLVGQGTLQENMSSDPITGLTRRAPTDLVGLLGTTSDVRGWHNFETRDGNKYLAFFHNSTVDVFDLNATSKTCVVDADAAAYITLAGNLRFSTDEDDETIMVNRSKVPAMTAAVATYYNTATNPAGIVQILGGQYGRKVSIMLDGVVAATYTPRDGSSTSHTDDVRTTKIAQDLAAVITLANGATSGLAVSYGKMTTGWVVTCKEDVILLVQAGSTAKSITVTDDYGNVNSKAMTTTVPDVADLPRIAPHMYVVRVAEQTDPDQDLWFKFVVDDLSASSTPDATAFGRAGYWQECVAPGVATEIDGATMPHLLTYDGTDFAFTRGSWTGRHVGTLTSNPNPSFIGQRIQDVSSFQGRTVFLAGSNVVMSRTNRPTDFWQGSASALADSDPIDVNSKIEASTMIAAVQHNRDLAVFSPKGQFVVFGRNAITPENAALVLTTKFEAELQAHPASAGRNVFFASNFGRYTGIREFFAEGGTDMNDSRPVTQHVKQYIVGTATLLTTSANYDTLIVHTDATKTDMFVYQYIWADTEKVQSAWSKWKLHHDIVHSFFDEDTVYLVQQVGTSYYLLRMPLDVQHSTACDYAVHLDQRFDVSSCYTAFVLPFDYLYNEELVCVQSTGCPTPGMVATISSIVYDAGTPGYIVTLKHSMLGGDLIVGTKYLSKYKPTMPSVKDADGVIIGGAKVRTRSFIVSLSNTGEITGIMRSKYGDGPAVRFNGRIVGDIENVVGVQPLSDEHFVMPFRQDVRHAEVEFYTDSHLPMTLSDIEWVGQYSKRGRRITSGAK